MEYATRDTLLGTPPTRRYADVETARGTFRVRSLTALEANTVQAKVLAEDDVDRKVGEIVAANCRLIAQCVVDAENHRIFSDLDVKDLLELDAAFINDLAAKCQKHAGIDPEGVDKAEKN